MTEDALLAAIYAAPADDQRRLVYADWLLEHGDRRGEFIALQFARLGRAPTAMARKRERWLLRKRAAVWLGPVWANLHQDPLLAWGRQRATRFERGFLEEVVTRFRLVTPVAEGDPRWSTVRTLVAEPHDSPWPLPFYLHDVLRNVETFMNCHADVACELLGDERPRALHTLYVNADPGRHIKLRDAIHHASHGPALRDLGLAPTGYQIVPATFDWLWRTQLGWRLEILTLHAPLIEPDVSAWRRASPTPNLRKVRFLLGRHVVEVVTGRGATR